MKLHSTWDVRSAAGEPAATVRVQSLGASLTGPADAWGRTGRPQPSETTVEVNMSRAFRSSSAADAVQDDTVHYGLLSKEVLRLIADATDAGTQGTRLVTLKKTVADIVLRLVGVDLLLGEDQGPAAANGSGAQNQAPFLPAAAINSIHVTLLLSKASLLGDGASITGSAVVCPVSPSTPRLRAVTLKIHNVRVPTLIGVNSNEREAEQMVLANLEVGKWVGVPDGYVELERVVYKTMRDSSYETLEALAETLVFNIANHLHTYYAPPDEKGWRLKIGLEKPIAVPMADAPCVEMSVDSADLDSGRS